MTASARLITSTYYAAIAHPREPRLLLLPDPSGWRLPGFSLDGRRFWQEVSHVNSGVRQAVGAEVTTLRCLAIDYQREAERLSMVYAVELRDPAWAPPRGAIWASRAELGALELTELRHRQVLADWLAWYERPGNQSRVAWYMPGWYDEAGTWAVEQLRRAGLQLIGPVEQARSWQRSAILRLPTVAGYAYFKAVPPIFGHEPALTAALAAADPARFAPTIAIDPARGWLLMGELRGVSLETIREIERWEAALASFAEVQIASSARVDELRRLGVPMRPLAELTTHIEPLLSDTAATLPGKPAGLSDEQRARLAALAPRLRAMGVELASYGIPPALEHGDFWVGQTIVTASGYAFLDWSDSSVAHPFFSLLLFLEEIEDYFPKTPGVRERLRDAYLAPWAAFGSRDRLIHAFELAQPLAALHHALAYHQRVLPNMELRWEMELMLPFYLKMLLRLAA